MGGYVQLGTGSPSVSREIADVQKLIRSSGLKYCMHSAGTTVGMFLVLFASAGVDERKLG